MKIIGKTVGISVLTGACIGAILALVFALLGRPQSELGRETTL
jgi:gas vesicle protein